MTDLVLIAHNIRSAHNVGSMLRSADGLGVKRVYLTGYTPYPQVENDERLPHESSKTTRQIAKTALGAEKSLQISHQANIAPVIDELRASGYVVAALEQQTGSTRLDDFKAPPKLALIVGNEVDGIDVQSLKLVDEILEIPMRGQKESLNVAVASAIAIYRLNLL